MFNKKKKPPVKKTITISMIYILIMVLILMSLFGQAYACRSSSASVWFSSGPAGKTVICGQSVSATAYAAMRCGTCINGVKGTLTIIQGFSVSKVAAIIGVAEFFEPLTSIVPCNGLSPFIINLSDILSPILTHKS